MFQNVGKKIKIWAISLFIIYTIACIICGIIFLCDGEALGLIPLLVGPFASWVSSFLLYGFGQLVENSDNQKKTTQEISARLSFIHSKISILEELAENNEKQMDYLKNISNK